MPSGPENESVWMSLARARVGVRGPVLEAALDLVEAVLERGHRGGGQLLALGLVVGAARAEAQAGADRQRGWQGMSPTDGHCPMNSRSPRL